MNFKVYRLPLDQGLDRRVDMGPYQTVVSAAEDIRYSFTIDYYYIVRNE